MRARSTWQSKKSDTPRQAATSRKADIYTMNQEHPQPSPTDYENGDPDSWAETPVSGDKMSVNSEYEGGAVKRNEIGLGEFREDTWKHKDSDQWNGKGKYDNAKVAAERKAIACERLARATLRTADAKLIEGATVDFMALPEKSIMAMMKRLNAVSPAALPEQARFKRALACTKIAARMLGTDASPVSVERLATVMMSVDDPTLKSIIKTVASARIADDQEGQQDQDSQEQQEVVSQEQQEAALSADELSMLDSMLNGQDGQCAPCPPGVVPAVPAAAAPADDLSALFNGGVTSSGLDVSFDDDEESAPGMQTASDLDNIFSDDPEVQAQREIQAANHEARNRESGFGRVASSNGVKKLGAVQKTVKAQVDTVLESLWEKP